MTLGIRGIGLALAAGASLLLAGCVTPGYGGYGGYPGGGYGNPGYPSSYGNQMQGTVEGVDYSRITLRVDDGRSSYGERLSIRHDGSTRLYYQGQQYPVTGLERGDVIRIDAVQSGREWYARQIEVVRNVRDGGYGGDPYGSYGNDLRGTIGYVDTRARTIQLDGGGYGGGWKLAYDGRTTVEYQGRMYRPENLQRGDQVRVQARQLGYNQWLAERIVVERSYGRGW